MQQFRRILLICLFGLMPGVAWGQCQGYDNQKLVSMADETLTVSTAVKRFTAAKLTTTRDTAVYAVFFVQTNSINYTVGEGAISSAIGIPLSAPNGHYVCGKEQLQTWHAVRSGGTDATVYVVYFAAH